MSYLPKNQQVHPSPYGGGWMNMPQEITSVPPGNFNVPPGYPNVVPGYPNVPPGYPNVPAGYPNVPPGYPNVPPGYPNVPPGNLPAGNLPIPPGNPTIPPGIPTYPPGNLTIPPGDPNIPPGLEYLTQVDQLLVHQQIELLEVLTGFETENKYSIKNSLGQEVFYAAEESDCCTRNCCGPMRSMVIHVVDNYKNEVIQMNRPLNCQGCCFPCCLQIMEVSSPPGTLVGTIEQEWSILTPQFTVKNAAGDDIFRIEGPFCTVACCGDVVFKVMSKDGSTQVGKISKQWSGILREACTDADNFGISFPMDLDVKMKAVMLGACFLIDMMYFETSGNQNNQRF